MRPNLSFGWSPRRFVTAASLGCAVLMTSACAGAVPTSVPTDDPIGGLHLTMSASGVTLLATGAFADFGVNGGGARQVRVRIVDHLDLSLGIATDHPITLAEPPVVCLVGPYSAPDDAGLESPCWGEPDLSSALLAKLGPDGSGHYLLTPEQPTELAVELSRGTQRCDYPPGEWLLELKLNPLSGASPGATGGARYVPDTPFHVPISQAGPLTLLPTTETRYCGLATAVYQQQGEPVISAP
jgi:hypothetical protein